ncbi:MAG: tyrosine-type recombinase/integrase [Sulfurimonas sp.]
MADDNSYNPWNTNSKLSIININGSLIVSAENEEEKKLMAEFEKTVIAKANRLSKINDNVIVQSKETRDTLKLKQLCEELLEFKEKNNKNNQKLLIKYKQVIEYILIYFTDNQLVKQITRKDANDFRKFLLDVPKFWKNKADLKDKDLRLLVAKKSKLLDKYEKQAPRTVDEIIKRTRTVFEYFVDNLYITNNPFDNLTKIDSNSSNKTTWREFSENELHSIFKKTDKDTEEYKFMKFALYTGLRRGELSKLKKSDVNLEKGFIDVKGTKTDSAVRIVPLHTDLEDFLQEHLKEKTEDCHLFFNEKKFKLSNESREEKIGALINNSISLCVKEENKKELNIHSFRKNFAQELFLSDLFKDIDLKTMIGHSTKSDITDKHYLRGKRDYPKYKVKIDTINFKKYFISYLDNNDTNIKNLISI